MIEGTDPELRVIQMNPTFEAFGMAIDYLSHVAPFSEFTAAALADAVQRQLRGGYHLIALRGRKVVGYAGWMPTTIEVGARWVEGKGKLLQVDKNPDAMALTIVASEETAARVRLIRNARQLYPAMRIYFKRGGDRGSRTRKATVLNTVSES